MIEKQLMKVQGVSGFGFGKLWGITLSFFSDFVGVIPLLEEVLGLSGVFAEDLVDAEARSPTESCLFGTFVLFSDIEWNQKKKQKMNENEEDKMIKLHSIESLKFNPQHNVHNTVTQNVRDEKSGESV